MQPQPPDANSQKRRMPMPRVSRPTTSNVEEGEGNLWAVSYADLLMVLMSFFIIFFSFDNEKAANRGLMSIALGIKNKGDTSKGPELTAGFGQGQTVQGPGGTSTGAGANGAAVASASAGVKSTGIDGLRAQVGAGLKGPSPASIIGVSNISDVKLKTEITQTGDTLYINLPDDIFKKREFILSKDVEAELDSVYAVLSPHIEELEVVVIGHSDSSYVTPTLNAYLTNNFDLSSLRALRALQYFLSKGFPQAKISAQGDADGVRNSRTLSIRVQLKGASS